MRDTLTNSRVGSIFKHEIQRLIITCICLISFKRNFFLLDAGKEL